MRFAAAVLGLLCFGLPAAAGGKKTGKGNDPTSATEELFEEARGVVDLSFPDDAVLPTNRLSQESFDRILQGSLDAVAYEAIVSAELGRAEARETEPEVARGQRNSPFVVCDTAYGLNGQDAQASLLETLGGSNALMVRFRTCKESSFVCCINISSPTFSSFAAALQQDRHDLLLCRSSGFHGRLSTPRPLPIGTLVARDEA